MANKLTEAGVPTGRFKAARLMKDTNAPFVPTRKFRVTTDRKHNFEVSPNLLDRNFTVEAPNQVWVSDITYLWSHEGWSYLAAIIDLYNREVVGMSIKSHMDRSLVIDALKMAVWNKRPGSGLIFHSDRGSQYCSKEFRSLLAFYGMKSSMSRKGNCWDNAVAESFFHTLKVEGTFGNPFRSRSEASLYIFKFIEVFYNRTRMHSGLNYFSPAEFEQLSVNEEVRNCA